MADTDLDLRIPAGVLQEEFICPVCFDTLTDCYITPCGHNFCRPCIEEWCSRSSNCPVCTGNVTAGSLVKNMAADALLQKICQLKEVARQEYFTKLSHAEGKAGDEDGAATAPSGLSKVEMLFQTHMQRSLAQFKLYEKQAKEALAHRKAAVQLKYSEQLERVRSKFAVQLRRLDSDTAPPAPGLSRSASQATADAAIAELLELQSQALRKLESDFDSSISQLLAQYDKHLSESSLPPSLLPSTVRIRVQDHSFEFMTQLTCAHTVADLDDMLRQEAARLENPVREMGEGRRWKVKSAALGDAPAAGAGAGSAEAGAGGAEVAEAGTLWLRDDGTPLFKQCPLGSIPPGAVITFAGTLVCKDDQPQQCFTAEFVKGAGMAVDYFACVTCGINWVCEPCSIGCHSSKGHEVKPYLSSHVPSFACCYCVKKKHCCLPNYRTKKKAKK